MVSDLRGKRARHYIRRGVVPGAGVGYALTTSFAISAALFRRQDMNASTPSGRCRVSKATRVTCTLDSCGTVS